MPLPLPPPQRRVQKKRHEALERQRNIEKMEKLKEDRRIRGEVVKIARGEFAVSAPLKATGLQSLSSADSGMSGGFK